jgi:DNA-directed RNA polymerase specialized sigma24 family protein
MNIEDDNLRECIAGLPLRERLAFEMKASGATAEAIAAWLKVSRSGLYRILSSAQQRLKARLKASARARSDSRVK